jgi:hypothetical protein
LTDVLTLKPLLKTKGLLAATRAGCGAATDRRLGTVQALVIVMGDGFMCENILGIVRRRVCKNIL